MTFEYENPALMTRLKRIAKQQRKSSVRSLVFADIKAMHPELQQIIDGEVGTVLADEVIPSLPPDDFVLPTVGEKKPIVEF